MEQKKKRENWGTQIGVILAVAGSAIGLGNFLRFPGQATLYGGGAFMIPYFTAFLILAIPLSWAEWALGRHGGRNGFNSVAGIFRQAGKSRIWVYIGGMGAFIPMVISMYYACIQAWCLAYAIQYLTGICHDLGLGSVSFLGNHPGMRLGSSEAYSGFFASFAGLSQNGKIFSNGIFTPLLGCVTFCFLFNYYLIYRGISKGIEMFCKIAMPLLFVCSLLILVRVVTLGNPTGIAGQSFLDGLGFMWNPTRPGTTVWQTLSNPETWLAATSQIFFSVSLGFGLIVTYASYVREKDDIALSSLAAVSSNEFCEVVLGGIMIIPPAIMFLGSAGLTPETLQSSFSMGFITLPNVFEQMPAGQFFGFLFFFLLFLAAVTSAISMLQPSVALMEEGLELGRKRSIALTALVGGIGTFMVCYFSSNALVLDTFDFWGGNLGLFVMAMFQTILVSWVWGDQKMLRELDRGAAIRVPRIMGWVLKYISTPYLIIIFALWCWNNLGGRLYDVVTNRVVLFAILFLMAAVGLFELATWYSEKKWIRREKHQKRLLVQKPETREDLP
ncbi:MAG: sodium-dependent transporter [Planctomycetia bacterium]|nr:sodium-dependent transporter [Planctomycetia bacterium]